MRCKDARWAGVCAAMLFVLLVSASASAGEAGGGKGKAPVPPKAKLKEAEETIRELFGSEFRARDISVQLALAGKLLAQAEETRDDPAARYQALCMSRDLATRHADVGLAFRAIAFMDDHFKIDALEEKETVLETAQRAARTKEKFPELAKAWLVLADEAVAAESFDKANAACRQAKRNAGAAQDRELLAAANKKSETVRFHRTAFLRVAKAKKKLFANPEDPAANLAVGKYYFVTRYDWERGLHHLAKSADKKWSGVAAADLKKPEEKKDRLALADGWWDLADTLSTAEREAPRFRAAFWYNKILADTSGLTKLKIEKRLAKVDLVKMASLFGEAGAPGGASPLAPGVKKSVLVTKEEFAKIKELGEKARKTGDTHNAALSLYASDLRSRLAGYPDTWTEDEVEKRLKSEIALAKAVAKAEGRRAYNSYYVMNAWPLFVAGAKDNAEFYRRLSKLPKLLKLFPRRSSSYYEKRWTRESVEKYFENKKTIFASKAAKVQFCEYLKKFRINRAALEECLTELKK
jgi:hypothetical protein